MASAVDPENIYSVILTVHRTRTSSIKKPVRIQAEPATRQTLVAQDFGRHSSDPPRKWRRRSCNLHWAADGPRATDRAFIAIPRAGRVRLPLEEAERKDRFRAFLPDDQERIGLAQLAESRGDPVALEALSNDRSSDAGISLCRKDITQ